MAIAQGEIPEWPKGADCKSVGSAFEGSNPSLPIALPIERKGFSFLPRSIEEEEARMEFRFECARCSACCRGEPGFVFLTARDLRELASFFKTSEDDFLAKNCRV